MIDVGMLALVGGALGSAPVAAKFLGPTAQYLGDLTKGRVQEYVETRQAENVGRVVQNAVGKVELDSEGAVAPRVLGAVIDEAIFAEDELLVEYLGGVLASGRTPQGRDDRGVAWIATIKSMSTYTLRLHFLLYAAAVGVLQRGPHFNIYNSTECDNSGGVFIPYSELILAMDLADDEELYQIVNHAVQSLLEAELIGHSHYAFGASTEGAARAMQTVPAYVDEPGVAFVVSPRGAELFVWAAGSTAALDGVSFLTDAELRDFTPEGVAVPRGYSFAEMRSGSRKTT